MGKLYLGPEQVMTGAGASTAGASGLVPAPSSGDNEKFLRGDGTWSTAGGSGAGATYMIYGYSEWSEFLAAYNNGEMIFCKAAAGSNPASGELTRVAPMVSVNDEDTPTEVEFQFYASSNSHSDSQQCDQVYVYKLKSNDLWSYSARDISSKVVAGTGLGSSYNNGVLTLNNTAGLPAVTSSDNNKFLRVVNGVWAAYTVPTANGVSF